MCHAFLFDDVEQPDRPPKTGDDGSEQWRCWNLWCKFGANFVSSSLAFAIYVGAPQYCDYLRVLSSFARLLTFQHLAEQCSAALSCRLLHGYFRQRFLCAISCNVMETQLETFSFTKEDVILACQKCFGNNTKQVTSRYFAIILFRPSDKLTKKKCSPLPCNLQNMMNPHSSSFHHPARSIESGETLGVGITGYTCKCSHFRVPSYLSVCRPHRRRRSHHLNNECKQRM